MLSAVHDRGAVVAVVGEAGIGKTALLRAASEAADADGFRVLRAAGAASERHLPFACLHQLLQPLLGAVDSLPDSQRDAILAAVGRLDSDVADQFIVGLAVGNLLRECADGRPILALAEDLHWMDPPSLEVLGFVSRRIEHDPIVVFASTRDETLGAFADVRPEMIELMGLDDETAGRLIDDRAPGLDPALRARLLSEARGNPLALTELAVAWSRLPPGTLISSWVPITTRLEAAFASQVDLLPDATRAVLLAAALNDGSSIAEAVAAGSRLGGASVSSGDLAPAVHAGLVRLGDDRLEFRHPLVRSAVRHVAGPEERAAAHGALAEVLTDEDRILSHRAVAAVAPDESIAMALEDGAMRAGRRGAAVVAVAALERAATLSVDEAAQGRRLVRAADFAGQIGQPDVVIRLLDEAEQLDLDEVDRARAAWRRQMLGGFLGGDLARVRTIVTTIERMATAGDVDGALDSLVTLSVAGWWVRFDSAMRAVVVDGAERLPVPPTDPRLLSVLGMTSPLDRGADVLDRLTAMDLDAVDEPLSLCLLGSVAGALGEYELSLSLLERSLPGLRRQGRLSNLSGALAAYGPSAWLLGFWDEASAVSTEAIRLAEQTERPANAATARVYAAAVAAGRGDPELAESLVARVESDIPLPTAPLLNLVTLVRALAALTDGRSEDCFELLRPIFTAQHLDELVLVSQAATSLWVEAGVQIGAVDEVHATIERVQHQVDRGRNPYLAGTVRFGQALTADDDRADEAFAAAAESDIHRWPFLHARLLLADGVRLRRRRRTAEARVPLRRAREMFDQLGAGPWSDRARTELRAAGESSGTAPRAAALDLTPQELEIARLAASGLTNREIGQRLYLSHRTVGTHLYHVFPKLGITSRSELGAALEA
ncbi:helix-turn-helix transcriptional regulator [Dermatobacter hominis]|uniref:helix-turn-helix transcriptional regulator n=1 Tax=Dermatobacter hominis TaxID=2884263 RepID=UPI0035ABE52E